MGKIFRKTFLKSDIETCWEFFSNAENLSNLTPSNVGFVISDYDGKSLYEGQKISYMVKPLFNISLNWTTEITSLKEEKEFVDIQIKGPFKIWHHRHLFKEKQGGVEMIDIIHYKIPYGIFGGIVEKLIVKKKVKEIFDFRDVQIKKIFDLSH